MLDRGKTKEAVMDDSTKPIIQIVVVIGSILLFIIFDKLSSLKTRMERNQDWVERRINILEEKHRQVK